jgi:hypothetical protein
MATVVKNFRIKSGLVVEGTTGTIGGQNILTETGGNAYILNLVGGATLVKSVDTGVFNVDGSGNLTVNANTFDSYGSASAAQTAAATDATNKADAAQSAAQAFATSADTALYGTVTSDIATAKSAAESNAQSFANTAESNAIAAAAQDATDKANAAQTAAELTASNANASLYTTVTSDISTAKSEAISSANSYTDGKVADLVDSAPALLDTLNEIAAAIADNPNYATDVANLVATKADTSYVDTEISDLDTAAQGYASAAQSAAISAAATDATNKADAAEAAAEATAQAALDDVLDGTTPFSDININDVAKQIAARSTSLGSVVVTAYQFNKSTFKSGKFLVKIDNGTHNEISEILVTLDSSDNVAITEYAIVGTNGSRGTITADVDGTHCRIRVNPVNDSTITVAGTIFNS